MKNQYIVVKNVTEGASRTLYYNSAGPSFMVKNPEIFTNREKAAAAMRYADKYASGSELEGTTEIIKI